MYFNKKGILLILCQKYVTESCTFLESLLLILIAKMRHIITYLYAIYFRFSFYNLTNNTVSLYLYFHSCIFMPVGTFHEENSISHTVHHFYI